MNFDRLLVLGRRVVDGFRAFSLGQKIVVAASVLAIVAGVWVFTAWSSTPNYTPLFSNLAAKDASAIVEKLDATGTPYELADGGATVMVPQDKVYPLRLQMSAAGLPADSDTGYALLDKQGVTTSEFMQQIGYQRALEGELTKTVKSIDGVTSATVHLAIPKKDVFSDAASKPTAAIMVQTSGGKQLSTEQVEAVVHLVASSVEGLNPDDVTVADADGTVLAAPGQTGAGATGGRDQQTAAYEQRLSTSLQQMLTQVVGANHAVVKVTADLDFDQAETKSQTYASNPSANPLSESTSNETYTGTGAPANGGVLGQINGTAGTNGGNGTYQQQKSVKDNAVNSVIETRQSAPGKVRKLGVAVLLDETNATKLDIPTVQNLASSAVGLDAKRGDTIAVSAMPFDQTAANQTNQDLQAAQDAEAHGQLISLIKTGAVVLGVLVLLLGSWLASRRRRKRHQINKAEMRRLDELKADLERNRIADEIAATEQAAALRTSQPATALLTPAVEPDDGPEEQKMQEIEALVDDQPDEVARLLRSWMKTGV
ncbi:MAG: flagellar basal-body MS-ring/collar protein FliF [Labedaea sp.]